MAIALQLESREAVALRMPRLASEWDGSDDQELFELRFDRYMLTLTEREKTFPAGRTSWRG